MHARILPHIQPRQMEAEAAHAPDQPLHRVGAGMQAAVIDQAVGDQLQIGQQILRRGIGFRMVVIMRGLQARLNHGEEGAVRHVRMARAYLRGGFGKTLAIIGKAPGQAVVDADPPSVWLSRRARPAMSSM